MKIAEIYRSVQGEGCLTGTPSVFVRTSGCNLRCWFCDTPYASWHPEGVDMAVSEIVAQIEEWDCRHVVLTGGEPMLFAELIPLCERLRAGGRHVTVETAGTLYLPVVCDLMSISPKLANSAPSAKEHPHWNRRHRRECHRPDVLRQLLDEYEYQLKFVVDERADLEEIHAFLEALSRNTSRNTSSRNASEVKPECVLLMPQGIDQASLEERADWLRPYCQEQGWVFCPRKHIEWYGAVRGT